jgi:hypothetical protein
MSATPGFKPCEETPFLIEEGRWYHSMFYMDLPKTEDHLLGGNVTGLLWRLEDEPASWRLTYRFRYYNSPDPNDRKDRWVRWVWYVIRPNEKPETPPEELAERFKQLISYAARMFFKGRPDLDPQFHTLTVLGDRDRFFEEVQKQKPFWMHFGGIEKIER